MVLMAVYLGYTAARRVLESVLVRDLDLHPVRGPVNCVSSKNEVTHLIKQGLGDNSSSDLKSLLHMQPGDSIDITVSTQEQRRHWQGVKCHVHDTRIPERSYLMLAPDVLVASPELCFLQLASQLDLIQTIRLAMSFCGIYELVGEKRPDYESVQLPDGSIRVLKHTIFDRKPIMSIESALSFLDGLDGVPGVETARRALLYTLPNSGSPMETSMVIPLILPRRLGGFGLPRPTMNGLIPLDGLSQDIAGQSICRGDAVWEIGRFVLEYQSRDKHDNQAAYGNDYARQLALEIMGYEVIFVTAKQIADVNQMTVIALRIAKCLDLRLPKGALTPTKRLEELLQAVLL